MSTTSAKIQWRRAQNGSPHATYQRQPSAQGIAISQCLLKLTERELQILRLIAEDLPNKEIARRLGLSVKTIEFHKTRIFDRLEVRGVISAVRLAIREGLIEA